METLKSYTDKGSGGVAAIEAAGIAFHFRNGVAEASDADAAQAIIDAFDPLNYEKAAALARLADKRWAVQNGGVTINGVSVKTDAAGIATLTGAYNLAASGAQTSFRFKAAPGEFITMTAEQITALFQAVAAFIQACYDREGVLSAEIAAATEWRLVRTIDLSKGWPA